VYKRFTAESGVVFSGGGASRDTLRCLFDGNRSSFWEETANAMPIFVEVENRGPEMLLKYSMACGDLAARMPSEWRVLGSGNGSDWISLDERRMRFPWRPFQEKVFYPAPAGACKFFKFEFTGSFSGGPGVRVYELTLFYKGAGAETAGTESWKKGEK
jgi:hypothetical protein